MVEDSKQGIGEVKSYRRVGTRRNTGMKSTLPFIHLIGIASYHRLRKYIDLRIPFSGGKMAWENLREL